MNTFPADEQHISEVERGRSCEAVVSLAPGSLLTAGDAVLFALSNSRGGREPSYVKGGDSVLVSLTGVDDLGTIDPATGHSMYRVCWEPLGQPRPEPVPAKRLSKIRRPIPQG